ncbi:basic secretory protein-like protein [Pedobacter insulae]|uniref:Peptidase n=1 Tax=Pedobacter insulae TaxID=414048 RepID=A0A1I2ZMH6_9SPHI|nr:basic secretory protein-like protein [Pedobacter insulae]SFH39033.1 Peptidase [Pedobacter insulae]
MKKLSVLVLICSSFFLKAQEVVKKNGYTLIFESNYAELDPALKKRMIKTFFEVYPKLAKEYNPSTLKEVKFLVDTAYKGVAATSNGSVVYASNWMKTHPEDIDVVTHEVMHIVQNYGRSLGPGWLTEGIADFARYKFGVDNAGSKWVLPELKPTHHYRNSYRITARFFAWIEANVKAGTVQQVDKNLRERTYTEAIWKNITGKDLDELWEDYIKNPII